MRHFVVYMKHVWASCEQRVWICSYRFYAILVHIWLQVTDFVSHVLMQENSNLDNLGWPSKGAGRAITQVSYSF